MIFIIQKHLTYITYLIFLTVSLWNGYFNSYFMTKYNLREKLPPINDTQLIVDTENM